LSSTGRALIVTVFVLLSLIWGTTWAAIRIGLEGIPPFTGVAARFAIAAVILLVYARATGVSMGHSRRERWLWVSNAVLSFSASYGVVYWAEQWVPSGLGAVIFSTYPLMIAVMSHFALPGERLTPLSVGGILLGFAGVAVIFSTDFEALGGRQVMIASLVMLISPLTAAASSVIVKRYGAGVHPVSLTAIPMGMTAGLMAALALGLERHREIVLDTVSVSALLYLAIFGSAVTFTLYYWLLARIPATRAALIAYMIPVVAVFVGAVFLDEPITTHSLIGSALVIAGVALTVQAQSRAMAVSMR
jgi:drug/metabolite transporter (DMT)-like permease